MFFYITNLEEQHHHSPDAGFHPRCTRRNHCLNHDHAGWATGPEKWTD